MNKKILGIFVSLLVVAMLATPLVVCVNAKPTTATVVFRSETWGDLFNENEKEKVCTVGNSSNAVMKKINIIGNPPLTNMTPPLEKPSAADALVARGGFCINITQGSNTYTLLGTVEQFLITGHARPGLGLVDNEKATVTITDNPVGTAPSGWDGSTLELSIIWIKGEGKILGNRGTGIFKNVQFRGTYAMYSAGVLVPSLMTVAVYKVQTGTGEMMFP
jgi:hypothetical protein